MGKRRRFASELKSAAGGFATLECELGLHRLRPTRQQARRETFGYLELLYSLQGLYSSPGYQTPVGSEAADQARAT